jgi:hypothetical protein
LDFGALPKTRETETIEENGMKRIAIASTTLLLSLVMALSLIACKTEQPQGAVGGETSAEQDAQKAEDAKTAFALWETASQNSESQGAMSFVMGFQMEMEDQGSGSTFDVSMNGPVQMKNMANSENLQMSLDLQMNLLGQDLPVRAWYRDGYYYFDTMGMKLKQAMSGEEALGQNNLKMLTFTENAIREQSFSDTADGGKELYFVLDGAEMSALAKDSLTGTAQNSGIDPNSLNIEMDDVTVTVILDKNDDLAECTYAFTATVFGGGAGEAMTMTCHTAMADIHFGNVSILFPDDLDSYTAAPTAQGASSSL